MAKENSFQLQNTSMMAYDGIIAAFANDYKIYMTGRDTVSAMKVLVRTGAVFSGLKFEWLALLLSGKYTVEVDSETKIATFTFTEEFTPDLLPACE